jgi:hypothetical protein
VVFQCKVHIVPRWVKKESNNGPTYANDVSLANIYFEMEFIWVKAIVLVTDGKIPRC